MNLWFTVGGYAGLVAMTGLWLNARDAVIEEREGCNADKLSQALAAERQVAQRQRESLEARIEQLASEAERERQAARIADEARRAAEARPARIREVIRDVPRETLSGKCLDVPVPDSLVDGLRD